MTVKSTNSTTHSNSSNNNNKESATSSSNTKTIQIQVPENADPGDTLTFQVSADGPTMELILPFGSVPGDVLEIQVATTDMESSSNSNSNSHPKNSDGEAMEPKQEHSDDDTAAEMTTRQSLDLGNGCMLTFWNTLPSDHVDAPLTNDTQNSEYETNENDGTFAMPWHCGMELAKQWQNIIFPLLWGKEKESETDRLLPPRRRILELGSGLGLGGMSFAIAIQQQQQQQQQQQNAIHEKVITDDAVMVLTDVPAAIPLLRFHVEQHQSLWQSSSSSSLSSLLVRTRPLLWTMEEDHNNNEPPYDCLLGSDLLYNIDYIPHLVATIKRLLHPTHGIMILAVRWRKPQLERCFFEETGLDWSLLAPPTHNNNNNNYPLLSWHEFGDPQNETSNKYFHQTQIAIPHDDNDDNGKSTTTTTVLKSLADITEKDVSKMDSPAFEAWERAHIQFYVGRPKSTNNMAIHTTTTTTTTTGTTAATTTMTNGV